MHTLYKPSHTIMHAHFNEPSLTYTHPHTLTHTHTHTHTLYISLLHTQAHTHIHTNYLSISYTQTHTDRHTHLHTHSLSLSLSHLHTHTHTYFHCETKTLLLSGWPPPWGASGGPAKEEPSLSNQPSAVPLFLSPHRFPSPFTPPLPSLSLFVSLPYSEGK